MSIPLESITIGRCYLMEGGSVRRVTSTDSNGLVRYQERAGAGTWRSGGTNKRKRHAFAAQAVREVACEWAPETDGTE